MKDTDRVRLDNLVARRKIWEEQCRLDAELQKIRNEEDFFTDFHDKVGSADMTPIDWTLDDGFWEKLSALEAELS